MRQTRLAHTPSVNRFHVTFGILHFLSFLLTKTHFLKRVVHWGQRDSLHNFFPCVAPLHLSFWVLEEPPWRFSSFIRIFGWRCYDTLERKELMSPSSEDPIAALNSQPKASSILRVSVHSIHTHTHSYSHNHSHSHATSARSYTSRRKRTEEARIFQGERCQRESRCLRLAVEIPRDPSRSLKLLEKPTKGRGASFSREKSSGLAAFFSREKNNPRSFLRSYQARFLAGRN